MSVTNPFATLGDWTKFTNQTLDRIVITPHLYHHLSSIDSAIRDYALGGSNSDLDVLLHKWDLLVSDDNARADFGLKPGTGEPQKHHKYTQPCHRCIRRSKEEETKQSHTLVHQ